MHILCAALMLVGATMHAQPVFNYTSDNGLSNTRIRSFYEDRRGNVWVCTNNGLNCFDGSKIVIYAQNGTPGKSIRNDRVNDIVQIDDHTMVIGLADGLQAIDINSRKVTNVPLLTENNDTVRPYIIALSHLNNGEHYALAAGLGSFKLQGSGDKLAFKADKFLNKFVAIRHIVNDSKQRTWIVTTIGKVHMYEKGKKNQVRTFEIPGATNAIAETSSHTIYVSTERDGVYRFDENSRSFKYVEPIGKDYIISRISCNNENYLAVCTDGNGLIVYDESSGKVNVSDIKISDYNLGVSNVKDALLDSHGNRWVGVYWKGVLMRQRITSEFNYIGRRSALHNSIGTNCVTAITPDRNGKDLWVATDNCGIYHIDAEGTTSEHYKNPHAAGTLNYTPTPQIPFTVMSICHDSHGDLWLGGSAMGVVRMNTTTHQCTPLSDIVSAEDIPSNAYTIKEDAKGNIWMGTMGDGLYCYMPKEGKLQHYKQIEAGKSVCANAVYNPYINYIAIRENKLFLCTSDGLEVHNILENCQTKSETLVLKGSGVSHVAFDKQNKLWISSDGGLVTCQFGKYNDIKMITKEDGLSDNKLCHAVVAADGTIWISTLNGLCNYNPSSGATHIYRTADGLQGNEFNNASAALNGNIYFGGINGISYFNPSTIGNYHNSDPLKLRITGFYVNGRQIDAGDKSGTYTTYEGWIDEAREVNLCSEDNTFSIEVNAIGASFLHVIYSYSLDGEHWTELPTGQSTVTLSKMAPGTYTVHIRAELYGQTSEEKVIDVCVNQPWYWSWLARAIYLLVLIAIIVFIYRTTKERIRTRRILQQHQREEELNEARTQFFMNISHEIRTPMTLIISPLDKLIRTDEDPTRQHSYNIIRQNSQRILRLINQLMDIRKIEKGEFHLDYSRVELIAFLQNLYDLFEQAARLRNINFTFEHADTDRYDVSIDPQNFDKIVMNLLSNALKFTPDGGRITMSLKAEEQQFTLTVSDSGIGIPVADRKRVFDRFYSDAHKNGYVGTGIGLNLTQQLVSLHGGTIDVDDNDNGEQGSKFTVVMPKGRPEQMDAPTMEASHQEDEVFIGELTETMPIENGPVAKRQRIVLAEDDVQIRRFIHSELSSDFHITECSDGSEAWEYIQQHPEEVDLIITDVMMPKMDGTELCRLVKNNVLTRHLPVIILTAKTDDADRIEGLTIGADSYLTKPFNTEILRTTAANLIRQRQQLEGKYKTDQQTEQKIEDLDVTSPDEKLLDRIMDTINNHMSNPELNIEFISDTVGISRVHLHRKIKELTGQTPRDFLKGIRMKKAARLLASKHLDITDVSIAVGFKSVSTFSTSFKSVYGVTPSEYMKKHQED